MTQLSTNDCQAATSPLAYLADLLDYTLTHVAKTQPGLRGEYYDSMDFTALKLTRMDAKVDFIWGAGSPDPAIAPTTFSARWSGQVQPRFSETYTFYAVSSDGARLWVNEQLVVNNWTDHAQVENSGTITLVANQKYTLKVEHYKNNSNAAGIRLLWSSPSQAKEVIPPSQLSHANIDVKFLVETFHQPLGDLPGLCAAMDAPVSPVRLGVEVLRDYLKARHLPASGSAQANALAEAEKAYRLAAYRALLTRLGAAYEEFRLALTGSAEDRTGLAGRLGIQPARLDSLFLDPAAITEPLLEKLFGLVDTGRNPLATAAMPSFLAWRLECLRAAWYDQDHGAAQSLPGQPFIDPDLIGTEYLQTSSRLMATLWQERRTWIDTQLNTLKSARESKSTPLEGLNAILEIALALSAADAMSAAILLQKADDEANQGPDTTPWLDAHNLGRDAFLYLVRIGKLATGNVPVMETEWVDVYSILAQVQKRRQLAAWQNQEQTSQITLSPDFFQLPAPGSATAVAPLPAWRATAAARREWQDILQTRLDQEQAVTAALREAVRATEETTLPSLRDALIMAADAPGHDLETKAHWITDHLLIDAQVSGDQQTTRIDQAVETLQGLLYSLRTGQLNDTYPDLGLAADNFDEEWLWIGSYATWRAAMGVFLYPESILLPSLRQQQTPVFRALVNDTRSSRRLTPAQARGIAKTYADYYRDVCTLTLEATCQTDTHVKNAVTDAHKTLFYMFGRGGATGRVYWSAYDPQDSSGYGQTFWETVPGIEKKVKIVGAVPYQISSEERFIYLFVQFQAKGQQTLAFTKYDLERQLWDAELSELELPSDTGAYTIIVVQTLAETEPPQLFLRGGKIPGMCIRGLDRAGGRWETPDSVSSDQDTEPSDDWAAFRVSGYPTGSILKAVLKTNIQSPKSYWLCYQKTDGHLLVLKQNNMPLAPINAFAPLDLGTGVFMGAFQLTAQDEIFVFYRDPTRKVWYQRISASSGAAQSASAGFQRIIPGYGKGGTASQRDIAYQSSSGNFRCAFTQPSANVLNETRTTRVTPQVSNPFEITEHLPVMNLQVRRSQIQTAVTTNQSTPSATVNPESNLTYLAEAYYFAPMHLALQLQVSGHYTSALDWFRTVYDYRAPVAQRKVYHGLTLEETLPNNYQRSQDWLLDPLNPHAVAAGRANSYTRFTLFSLIDCFLDAADAEFTRDTAESVPRARTLYLTALELLDLPEVKQDSTSLPPLTTAFGQFNIPANPVQSILRLRAELNLFKLRHGRNIAGLERQLEPYAAPVEAGSGLPAIGAGGQLILPGAVAVQPTPYRYSVLVERAKTLVQLAAQIEAALLSALEKRDAELYNLLKAYQDVQLTRAGVRLQDLRVREAEDGVKLAQLQQERVQDQADHFQQLLAEGYLLSEQAAIALLGVSAALSTSTAVLAGGSAILGAMTFGLLGSSDSAANAASALASAASTTSSMLSTIASFERRRQEWEFQKILALQDIQIGAQQIRMADDHGRIVGQERLIAGMQADHAEVVVDFLANKFTNAELFDWMSGILERVYAYFLQQATAVAKLAENQLAFERQQTPPTFIQADYWEAPTDDNLGGSPDGRTPDRRGLTGSARLLQDIFQLDQYAFDTNQRKLQLTKTISLAQMAPAEFQFFRETGVMVFTTPQELFDRDFPGHYLRLIRRVRTSVVALIPPTFGIRATLSNTGVSRVVVGGPVFQPVVVNHSPQSVALSSPREATGLFELDQQPEMLLPFESLGVDATWEFRMPRAANLFDYNTIADVLLTIEYTALDSFDYRQQVIQTLNPNLSADRPFSFRHQFADAWYDLHNPDQTAQPMVVRFKTGRADFAPNLEDLRIQHVLLYFAPADGDAQVGPITATLRFSPAGQALSTQSPGGQATTVDGIISTRRGNATDWLDMLGQPSSGEWELALADTAEVRNLFKGETITDLLLVVTYKGRTPAWPA